MSEAFDSFVDHDRRSAGGVPVIAGIKARAEAILRTAADIREIDLQPGTELERLPRVVRALQALAADKALFPSHSFPRAPGTLGGLFQLASFPDRRGALYVSLGYPGRSEPPHNHISWAVIVGLAGGMETHVLYERVPGARLRQASLRKRKAVRVGEGDAMVLPTGFYHAFEVDSGPALQLHAHGWAVDTPGFETYEFADAQATTYANRPQDRVQPQLAVVYDADIAQDLARGEAALLVLDGAPVPPLAGRWVVQADAAHATLALAGLPLHAPVAVLGAAAGSVAQALNAADRPVVFEYRASRQRLADA